MNFNFWKFATYFLAVIVIIGLGFFIGKIANNQNQATTLSNIPASTSQSNYTTLNSNLSSVTTTDKTPITKISANSTQNVVATATQNLTNDNSQQNVVSQKESLDNSTLSRPNANDKNFAKAISAYLLVLDHYCVGRKNYPGIQIDNVVDTALIEAGLVHEIGKGKYAYFDTTILDVTPMGTKFFTPGRGFCLGDPELIRIENFTEPVSTDGYLASRVTFLWKLRNVPSWANESKVIQKSRSPNAQYRYTETFVSTNKGWVHKSLAP